MTRARRWALRVAIVLVLLVVAAGVVVQRVRPVAYIGSGVVAKQLCSCVFVDGRDLASCRGDLPPDTAPVRSTLDASHGSVRAWVPLLAERSARYSDGTGCTLY